MEGSSLNCCFCFFFKYVKDIKNNFFLVDVFCDYKLFCLFKSESIFTDCKNSPTGYRQWECFNVQLSNFS